MSIETLEWVAVGFGGLFLISFFIILYASYTKLEKVECCLQNCQLTIDMERTWRSGGYIGRMVRIGMICLSMLFAKSWGQRGILDITEIRSLPLALKRWMIIPMLSSVIFMICMFVMSEIVGWTCGLGDCR